MKTLIADDDMITRLLLSSALTKLGHEAHEAINGRQAWDAWQGGFQESRTLGYGRGNEADSQSC